MVEIDELYLDWRYYSPFESGEDKILDLSSFTNLRKFYFKYNAPYMWNTIKLIIQNGTNLQNNLMVIVDFNKIYFQYEDLKYFPICLDSNVTEEFINNNVVIKSVNGITGVEAVTISCD